MTILVSPTEPKLFHSIGQTSSLPESRGVDFLWSAKGKLFGVQRKTPVDFLASIGDRLNTAFHKAATLDTSILLLEGAWKWTRDGIWAEAKWGGRPFTRKQLWGLLASIQSRGHWIAHTADINETITYLEYLYSWSQKDKHDSLDKAPKVQSAWGGATETDKQAWAICVMCEGIGLEMAKRLVEANGGRVPLQLTMTPDEIKAVNGWGDKRVKVLTDAFGSMDHVGGERR